MTPIERKEPGTVEPWQVYAPTSTKLPVDETEATARNQLRRKAIDIVRQLRRSQMLISVAIATLLVGILSTALPRRYSANALLFPQVIGPQSSDFANIAARFGLGSFSGGLSLDFYSDVLTSRSVMDSVLVRAYAGLTAGPTLLDELGYIEGDTARRLESGAKTLRKRVSISSDETAGLLSVSVSASSPILAVELLDSLLAITNRAVATALITQATYQRQYLEARLAEARREMGEKEAGLESFYSDNRTWQQAPNLVLRETRLRREVDIARDLYGTIRREYEQARMSEARDIPTLSFVSAPAIPFKPASPKPLRNGVLAGFAVGSIWIALRLLRNAPTEEA